MSENLSSSEFAERSTPGQTVNVSRTPARNAWGAVSRALGGRPFVVLSLEYLETVQKCSPIIVSHCLRSRWENFDWYAWHLQRRTRGRESGRRRVYNTSTMANSEDNRPSSKDVSFQSTALPEVSSKSAPNRKASEGWMPTGCLMSNASVPSSQPVSTSSNGIT